MKIGVGQGHGFIISRGAQSRGYTKSSMNYHELLARAAQVYGIELRYTDTWGREHEASPEVLRALLASLGFSAGSAEEIDRKSTRLNSSHANISYAVFCLKKKKKKHRDIQQHYQKP